MGSSHIIGTYVFDMALYNMSFFFSVFLSHKLSCHTACEPRKKICAEIFQRSIYYIFFVMLEVARFGNEINKEEE